ncbi:uncharacterized protein LOC119719148 [Patiria miniata]|uniref:THAP-type domain-containing protein n=1 Tax=Patiria miniata TaxID=46514 RepID=A0A913Z085_PATMI|nr:uncharacterized protein LOC119719148 [Patiria miniata]
MVNFCAIIGCSNRGDRDKKSFFRLPAVLTREGAATLELSQSRRAKWLSQIARDIKESNLPYVRVCSDHFTSGKPSALYDNTNPDWAPTVKLGHSNIDGATATRDLERYQRRCYRQGQKSKLDAAEALLQLHSVPKTPKRQQSTSEEACQTDLDSNSMKSTQTELQRLLEENRKLKEQLAESNNNFDRQFFQDNDENVKHFTGLSSFAILDVLFTYLETFIVCSCLNKLTKFQQLVLCLIKLRLNPTYVDLGQRFNVHKSTASKTFLNIINIMYIRLMPLIFWPDREQLWETMPMSFRTHFGKQITVIIDCFEIFLERPSNLAARTSTWSSYKHNNTVKYLIGITPQGVISYLSQGWGGRASDKYVVEHSSFLHKLCPGDVVMADRGFDVSDSVGMMGAKLVLPAFRRDGPRLSGEQVENTRRVANSRIHVERVIGHLRQKYTILHSTIPMDFVISRDDNVTLLDKITVVSCSLTNMCPSVVPFD